MNEVPTLPKAQVEVTRTAGFFTRGFAILGFMVFGTMIVNHLDQAIFQAFHIGQDTTDGPDSRSGLALFTDHMTGCQYVGSPYGGVTPRIDRDGNPICN